MGLRSIYSTALYQTSLPILANLFRVDFSCDGNAENDKVLSFTIQNAIWPGKEVEEIFTYYAGLVAYHKGKITIRWYIIFNFF